MTDKPLMEVKIDETDDTGKLMNAVMEALHPICRDPTDPNMFDGRRAVEVLGACAAMIFAGIPEEHRAAQLAPWLEFVAKASTELDAPYRHTVKVVSRA